MTAAHSVDPGVLELIREGVIILGPTGRISHMNSAASRLTGWKLQEAQGKIINQFLHFYDPVGKPVVLEPYRNTPIQRDLVLVRRDGRMVHVSCRFLEFPSSVEANSQALVLRDRRRVERMARHLYNLSSIDPLTGLINRRAFIREIEKRRLLPEQWVMEIHVDWIGATYSLAIGESFDGLMKRVAELLEIYSAISKSVVARLGESTFGVAFSADTQAIALTWCSRLQELLSSFEHQKDDRALELIPAVGLVQITPLYGASSILDAAHVASLIARGNGQPSIYVVEPNDIVVQRHYERANVHSQVSDVLRTEKIELFYQPIVPLLEPETEPGDRFEMLCRIADDQGRNISAFGLISAAENHNLVGRLTDSSSSTRSPV